MQVVNKHNLYEIQIDVTSYCNSFCGTCVRNISGGPVSPYVKLEHMYWNIWKDISNFCADNNVRLISFNGNFGDMSSHPKFVEMLKYLYSVAPDIKLNIHTNGGARSETFWKELGNVVQKFPASYVTFSIDGLEDTNHIYRRGTIFNTIIKNASAYINAGGSARWRMIVFDHNKHQIEEASNFAKDLGFFSFSLNRSFDTSIKVVKYKDLPEGLITAPQKSEVDILAKNYNWKNKTDKDMSQLKDLKIIDSLCPWQQERKIQINQIGEVWPCCYFSMHSGRIHDRRRFEWLDEKLDIYEKDFNNLKKYNLDTILKHDFFIKDLQDSFKKSKLKLCTEKCGV